MTGKEASVCRRTGGIEHRAPREGAEAGKANHAPAAIVLTTAMPEP